MKIMLYYIYLHFLFRYLQFSWAISKGGRQWVGVMYCKIKIYLQNIKKMKIMLYYIYLHFLFRYLQFSWAICCKGNQWCWPYP